eukprot:gene17239-8797_t
MDSLRGAAIALKKSPRAVRKKLDRITGKKEGKKLFQSLDDDVTFCVKQLGSIDLRGECDSTMTETAVRNLLTEAKKARMESKKKLSKTLLTVATDKICAEDATTKELLYEIELQRVSRWQIDAQYPQVFSFIEDKQDSPVCHAYISPKTSVTEDVTKAVATALKFIEDSKKEGIVKRRDDIDKELDREAEDLYSDLGSAKVLSVGQSTDDVDVRTRRSDNSMDAETDARKKEINVFNDLSSSDDEAQGDPMKYIYSNIGLKNEHSGENMLFDATDQNEDFERDIILVEFRRKRFSAACARDKRANFSVEKRFTVK